MKKVILTAIAVLGCTFANAQTEKGKLLVSGATSIGFGSFNSKFKPENGQTQDGLKTSSFNIKPAVGFFAAENFMLGLAVDFETTTQKFDSFNETSSSISVIPQAAYYFGKSNVKPFLNAGLGIVSVSDRNFDDPLSGTVWAINGGIAYFVSKSVSFDFGVGYQSVSLKIEDTSTSQAGNSITAGIASQVGIAVYF